MHDVVYPFIYWPIGIAFGGWLFFEIARRMLQVRPRQPLKP